MNRPETVSTHDELVQTTVGKTIADIGIAADHGKDRLNIIFTDGTELEFSLKLEARFDILVADLETKR